MLMGIWAGELLMLSLFAHLYNGDVTRLSP